MAEENRLWRDVTNEDADKELVRAAFQDLFAQKNSPLLQSYQETLDLTQIEQIQCLWADCSVLWEERELEERQCPTEDAPTPGHRHTAEEYQPWDYDMPSPPADFSDQHHEMVIPGSEFVDACHTCDGSGKVTCPHCGGYGSLTCDYCGGSGIVQCSGCGGYGYHDYSEWRGGGSEGSPYQVTRRQTCYTCGGSGKVSCSSCGGSGAVVCGGCGGAGIVTCQVCEGAGKLLFDVALHQNYFTRVEQSCLSKLEDLLDLFPDFQLFATTIQPPVLTAQEEGALSSPSLGGIFSKDEMDRLVDLSALDDLLQDSRSELDHLIRQGVTIYSKPLYYIHFTVSGASYRALFDPTENTFAFDRHPFHDLFDAQLTRLKELHDQRRYRELYTLTQQILELTADQTQFAEHETVCRQVLKRVGFEFFLTVSLGDLAGWLVGALILMALHGMQRVFPASLVYLLPVAIVSFLSRALWPKLPCDEKNKFLLSGLAVGGVLSLLITLVLGLLFG